MKIAVMQPYLFPYLGYFQLIRIADDFVVYDDVNFTRSSWINRNYILGPNGKHLLTLPLKGASQNKLINEIITDNQQNKLLKTLKQSYSKAPQFDIVYPILEEILNQQTKNLAVFLEYQLKRICHHLGLQPKWHISSELKKDEKLRGQEKILAICELLDAKHYINLPGGTSLYDREAFSRRNLELSFIQPRPSPYRQYGNDFVANLSIVDVMMFNDKEECAVLLNEFDLV